MPVLDLPAGRLGGEQRLACAEQVEAGLLAQLLEAVPVTAAEAREEPVTNWGCEECGKQFHERRHLYFHTRLLHSEPGTCNICNKAFPSKVKVMQHMQRAHMEQPDRAFICSACGPEVLHNALLWQYSTALQGACERGGRLAVGTHVGWEQVARGDA